MTNLSKRSGLALLAGLLLATLAAYALYARPSGAGPAVAAAQPIEHGALATALRVLRQPSAAHDVLAAIAATPTLVRSGDDGVELSVRSDRAALLQNGQGDVNVEVTLSADGDARSERSRKPSDVLVVLDVSGSMSGQKLEYAKQALHQLIDRLDGDDRFALVSYASEAQLLFPLAPASERARAQLHGIASGLVTLGGTNMSAGLDLGIAELARRGDHSRSARVLLLSDGQANEGDSSAPGLQARARELVRGEHVLSTLGIGDDFNEDLMTSLADVGTGNFYYLSKVEVLGDFFDAELRATQQTVARALELRFDPGPGVQVLEASGYPIEREGALAILRPGNLYAGQKRTLWISLRAPTQSGGQVPIGSFSLLYKHGEVARQLDGEPLPALTLVADQHSFERNVDKDVWQRYVLDEQQHAVQARLGAAVGSGTAADVDRALGAYERNAHLAAAMGLPAVSASIDAMRMQASASKKLQAAPTAERAHNAKQQKARALYDRRADNYRLSNPTSGL
jgi:Ca-activated chloride channel family protein